MSIEPNLSSLEPIVSLCKRRGFIFPSSEIYGGLGSCYDYGPVVKRRFSAVFRPASGCEQKQQDPRCQQNLSGVSSEGALSGFDGAKNNE